MRKLTEFSNGLQTTEWPVNGNDFSWEFLTLKEKKKSWHPNQKSEPHHMQARCMYPDIFSRVSCTVFVSSFPFLFFLLLK